MAQNTLHLLAVVLIAIFALSGCTDKKQIALMSAKIDSLQTENKTLKDKILKLEMTDQYFYQKAIELYQIGKYDDAIIQFNDLKLKFPASPYISESNKMIVVCEKQKKEKYNNEVKLFNALVVEAKKVDIEVAIKNINIYIQEEHPSDLIEKAKVILVEYNNAFENIKVEREATRVTGIQITSIRSEWDWSGMLGDRLLCPQLVIAFKNVSQRPITELIVKANFVNVSSNEIFGEASSYVIGYGDTPLQPGYTKKAYLTSSVGYKSDYAALSFPNLVADVYVNNVLYKKVKISRRYAGVSW